MDTREAVGEEELPVDQGLPGNQEKTGGEVSANPVTMAGKVNTKDFRV